jgi:hypothetical protein
MASSSPSPYGKTEWKVGYILPEPCDCTEIEGSPSIEFTTKFDKKIKPNSITGFTITVIGEYEDEILEKANKQAERLAQIMTVKSRGYVSATLDGYRVKTGTNPDRWSVLKKISPLYHIRQTIELDLNNKAIISIIENDEDINLQLYHASLAIEAEENRRFADMYRELFQVIEKEEGLQDYCKYKSLRAAISHQRKLDRAKDHVEKYFGKGRYDFTANHEFDHNSNKNRENLKKDANDLKTIVMSYLSTKMQ